MKAIDVTGEDIHRLVGRAKASAPDPATFQATRLKRIYRDFWVERGTTGPLRVISTPPMRKDPPSFVMHRSESGSVAISRGANRCVVAAGESILLLSSGQYDIVSEGGAYTELHIPLRQFAPVSLAHVADAVDIASPPSRLNSAAWAAIDALLDAPEDDEQDAAFDPQLTGLVVGLMTQFAVRTVQSQRRGTRSPLLTAAVAYLEDHLDDPTVDVEAMALALGTSRRTLHREFALIGTSPLAALREARLTNLAQRLNTRTALPSLETLAHEYGYKDRTALARAFHRRFGMSPTDHRRRVTPFPEPSLTVERTAGAALPRVVTHRGRDFDDPEDGRPLRADEKA